MLKPGPPAADRLFMTAHPSARPAPARRGFSPAMVRRRQAVLTLTVAVLAGTIAAPAVADVLPELGPAQQVRGVTAADLRVHYQGAEVSWSQLHELQLAGHAGVTVVDRASARDAGLAHAFDTQAEADAWTCATSGEACPEQE